MADDTIDDQGGVDLRAIWGSIVKFKWLIAAVTVVVTVAVGIWSLGLPKVYDAHATVEFDPSPPRPLGKDVQDVADPTGGYLSSREWLKTQQQILTSRQVCEAVVRQLGLHRDPDFFGIPADKRSGWRGEELERAANALRGRIEVSPVEGTRIVEVHVRDSSPDRAAMLANAVAEAFIDKTQRDRLGSTLSALDWLSSQLDTLTNELEEAELSLHHFKKDHNVLSVSLQDRLNVVAGDIEKLSSALTEARMQRIHLQAHLDALRRVNETDPLTINTSLTADDPALSALRARYREAASEKGSLSSRYGPNHPRIEELDAKLNTLHSQIGEEIDGLLRGAQSDLDEARSVEGGLAAALEERNQDGLELNLQEIEYDRLNRQRENKAKLQAVLLERTAETNLTRMLQVNTVRVLDRALSPRFAVKPNVRQNVGFGFVGGILIGLALAAGLGFLDRTVKHQGDVEALGATFLGIVPIMDAASKGGAKVPRRLRKGRRQGSSMDRLADDLMAHHKPTSSVAECARVVRTNLTFMSADQPAKSIVVTSSSPQEGKTTIAVNLAIVVAQTGRRVLLVDTDLRRPRLHRIFQVSAERGITSYLVGEARVEDTAVATEVPNLSVLPCGPIPPNPSELLHTSSFDRLVQEATRHYDLVIFDSPPLGAVTDAAIIAPQVDGTVLVARVRKTHKDMVSASKRQLQGVGATLLGVVLNAVDLADTQYGYRYYQYTQGGYHMDEDGKDKDGERRDVEAA
jgi:polysaccharide biosynthesis transport protein